MSSVFSKVVTAKLMLLSSAAAFAQTPAAQAPAEQPPGVSDIIVTAQRREQNIFDVPVAITAVTGDALAAKGITDSSQLQSAVPNLQITSVFGNTQPNFTLRGIGVANEYNSNQASPVGVYMDDVYLASRTLHGQGLYDVDRIEVLRGPQGTLFGRNTTGGAINFITRKPRLKDTNGYFEAGYGNFNTYRMQGAVETTMVENQLGVRASFNYINGDGVFKSVFPGVPDAGSTDLLQGRVAIVARPGDDRLQVTIRAYGGRSKNTQWARKATAGFSGSSDFFSSNLDTAGMDRIEGYGVMANVAYELSDQLTATSITSYDAGKQSLYGDQDGGPADLIRADFRAQFDQFSEEFRLNYAGKGVNVVGGVFYGVDTQDIQFPVFFTNPGLPGGTGGYYQEYTQKRKSKAVFAQADVDLVDKLTLTLGARYTWDNNKYRDGFAYLYAGDFFANNVTPLGTTVPCPGQPICLYDPTQRFNLNGKNKALTGRVALAYTFDNGALVYASYNRGYRSGAFNGGSYNNSDGINYVAPEKLNAYEIGAKGRFFDRKLSISTAAYYYDYINQQLQDSRPGPVTILVNAPKSRIWGLEAESEFYAADFLTLRLAAGYQKAEYRELTLQGADLSGKTLPFAPKLTVQGSMDIKLFQNAGNGLVVTPSAAYTSRQYFTPFNTFNANALQNNSELQQASFVVANLTAGYTIGNITVKGFVNNLFEEKYYTYGIDLRGAGFPYNTVVPNAPRTYGGSVRVTF